MMKFILYYIVLLFILSCSSPDNNNLQEAKRVLAKVREMEAINRLPKNDSILEYPIEVLKSSRLRKINLLLVLLSVASFSLISCTEENSDSLPDGTYVKQDYSVLFSDKNPTLAYALFQKQNGKVFSEVKLTGEQKV